MATTTEVLTSANDLLAANASLLNRVRAAQRSRRDALRALPSPPSAILNLPLIRERTKSPPPPPSSQQAASSSAPFKPIRNDLSPAKRARAAKYRNYVPEEETIRNDYSQRYVDGGEWPQNWVIGAEMERRFEEYPKQQRLLALKKVAVAESAHPALYLSLEQLKAALAQRDTTSATTTSPASSGLPAPPSTASSVASTSQPATQSPKLAARPAILSTTTGTGTTGRPSQQATSPGILLQPSLKFDVILIDPPFSSSFTWDALEALPVAQLAADPSFVFLWVGSGAGDGLERGREVLGRWGYRRCEDICWVKTNEGTNKGPGTDPPTNSLLTRTKQHCLMGIRGTVRRSTDSWFVHCNVDTDVIIWPGDPTDPTRKPPETYQLIENFCLGMRRLELFGRAHSLRRGWVTVTADELSLSPAEAREHDNARPFDREEWQKIEKAMNEASGFGKFVVPQTPEIESLRPKSPTPRGHGPSNSGSGPSLIPGIPMNPNAANLPPNPVLNAGGGGVGGGQGMNRGTSGGPDRRGGFNANANNNLNNNQMMMQRNMGMMGMVPGAGRGIAAGPMGNMGNMGNMGPGGMNVMQGMGGMGGGMPMGGMQVQGMNNMNNMNNMNMGMQGMSGGAGGFGFDDGSGMMGMQHGAAGMGMGPPGMNMGMGMAPMGSMGGFEGGGGGMYMGGGGMDGGGGQGNFDGMGGMGMNMGAMPMGMQGANFMGPQMVWDGSDGHGFAMNGGPMQMGGMGMGRGQWGA